MLGTVTDMNKKRFSGRVNEEMKNWLMLEEECVPHMYCDSGGFVTVGVGCLLASQKSAMELPFIHKRTAERASREEIIKDYNRVIAIHRRNPHWGIEHYRGLTELFLPFMAIEQLLEKKIEKYELALSRKFPNYNNFPAPARLALVDMVFTMGIGEFIKSFSKLIQAAHFQDWLACSNLCYREAMNETRNEATAKLFVDSIPQVQFG